MNEFTPSALKKFLYCLVLLCAVSCNRQEVININNNTGTTLKINGLQNAQPLSFEQLIENVRYVFLENFGKESIQVDKILFNNKRMYILDKSKDLLLIYNSTGALQSAIKEVRAFNVYKEKIYTYNTLKGIIKTYTLSGNYLNQNIIGFRGVDFINLNDSLFAFHTAGLVTKDKGSSKYEVAYVYKDGRLAKFTVPIPEDKQGVNYAATGRFSCDKENTYFIPSLGNELYQLKPNQVKSFLKFDFGQLTLTDSLFKTFKEIEDYSFFPYIFNITNKFNTNEDSFFSCTYKGAEAYFVVQNSKKHVIASGLSNSAGIRSDFNNTIPEAFSNNEYISIIERKEFISNYNLLISKRSTYGNAVLNKLSQEKIESNKNPVLMFFKLKDLNLYNGTRATARR